MLFKKITEQFRSVEEIRTFLFKIGAILLFVNICVSFAIYFRTAYVLTDAVRQQAESYFRLMVISRAWNAGYGGVYVEKQGAVESNPYLRAVGIEPDISADGGRIFTMRNPAAMTREISEISGQSTGVHLRITSTLPLNPANAPDEFEQQAFKTIGSKSAAFWEIGKNGNETVFRYMAPLFVEQSCLKCHAHQGYKVGDIRGGISITIPFDGFAAELTSNKIVISMVFIGSSALLLGILYFMGYRLSVRLHALNEQLIRLSITDELTGASNRRAVMERLQEEYQRSRRTNAPLSIMMLDLDHFKQINDTYGHHVGDEVLKAVGKCLKDLTRYHDVVARLGGEEFAIIVPNIDGELLQKLAERVRRAISALPITSGNIRLTITTSVGLAIWDRRETAEQFVERADKMLYEAKRQGRNRVCA